MTKAQKRKAEAAQDEQFTRTFGTEHRSVVTNRPAPRSPLNGSSPKLTRVAANHTTNLEK
jgi:hypothetical protein